MIRRHLFPGKYSGIPEYILKKAAERGAIIHKILQDTDEKGIVKVKLEIINPETKQ